MNKGILIAGTAGAIILVTLTADWFNISLTSEKDRKQWWKEKKIQRERSIQEDKNEQAFEDNKETANAGGTLQDAINGKFDQNIVCHLSYPVHESTLDTVTYINGQNIRVDYKMTPPIQGQENLHMIAKDGYGYVWGDSTLGNALSGMKFKIDSQPPPEEVSANQPINYTMDLINCNKWDVDASLFELPKGVEFSGLPDMTKELDSEIDPCQVCNQLPGEQVANCLKAMECN